MNRQERRQMEKLNRKQTVRMTPDRIQEVKDTISEKVSKYASQQMMIAFAIALHNTAGFGAERILRTWKEVDKLMGRVCEDVGYIDILAQQLEDLGLKITYD